MRPIPIGRRSRTVISSVDGSTRRIVASSTHGDDSSRCRHAVEPDRQDVLPAQAVDQRQHFAGGQPLVAAHDQVADLQRLRIGDEATPR